VVLSAEKVVGEGRSSSCVSDFLTTSEKNVFRPQKKSEFDIVQLFSFRKYPKSSRT